MPILNIYGAVEHNYMKRAQLSIQRNLIKHRPQGSFEPPCAILFKEVIVCFVIFLRLGTQKLQNGADGKFPPLLVDFIILKFKGLVIAIILVHFFLYLYIFMGTCWLNSSLYQIIMYSIPKRICNAKKKLKRSFQPLCSSYTY